MTALSQGKETYAVEIARPPRRGRSGSTSRIATGSAVAAEAAVFTEGGSGAAEGVIAPGHLPVFTT